MDSNQIYYREYECTFCLEVTTSSNGPPRRCSHCCVVFCVECGTALKGDEPTVCHGCGAVFPTVHLGFSATDSFACCYLEHNWAKRNKGHGATGDYSIATGVADHNRGRCWVVRHVPRGDGTMTSEDVRELTPQERERYLERPLPDYCI